MNATFSVFELSYRPSGNEFLHISIEIPCFDPLPGHEELCGNLFLEFATQNELLISRRNQQKQITTQFFMSRKRVKIRYLNRNMQKFVAGGPVRKLKN